MKDARGPVILPILLTITGILVLLDNFLFLEQINMIALLPLLLVVAGLGLLLRGDFIPDESSRTFGITRGSVESALVEVSAGEIDVQIGELNREGRLIAGRYAANARPALTVDETHTHLRFNRSETTWSAFADWELALTTDLPWEILVSTHLGHVKADLSGLIVEQSTIATGFGDIYITCPQETLADLHLQSTVGNVQFVTPLGYKARIAIYASRFVTINVDDRRYAQVEANRYIAKDANPDAPLVDVQIHGTFGDIYLA